MERYDDRRYSFQSDSGQSMDKYIDGDEELGFREDNIDEYDRPIGQGVRMAPRNVSEWGLAFEDLTYTIVKNQKIDGHWESKDIHLLEDISGRAVKGQLTAIMGPRGAGKSTFLDALAGRISQGSLSGTLRLDSRPVTASYIRRKSAYVMQQDVLFPLLTVTETLLFYAEMHLPSLISDSEKADRVQGLILQLDLEDCADTRIGDENRPGITPGEKRRVSIAIDIIHGPSLLFLDEPTSGLDAASALLVVEKLSDIATAGSTVLLTIRNPSFRIQTEIDRMIVLARGRLVFQGPPADLATYIEVIGRDVPANENNVENFLGIIKEFEQSKTGLDQLVQLQRDDSNSSSNPSSNTSSTPRIRAKFGTLIAKSPKGDDYVEPWDGGPDSREDYVDSEGGFDHSLTSLRSPLTPGLRLPKRVYPTAAYVKSKLHWGSDPRRTRTYLTASVAANSHLPQTEFHKSPIHVSGAGSASETPVWTVTGESDNERDEDGQSSRYHNDWLREVILLVWRGSKIMLRTRELFLEREIVAVGMSIFLATLFRRPNESFAGIQELNGYVIILLTLVFFSCNNSLPIYIQERTIFIRETERRAYQASSYIVSSLLLHLPSNALQALAYLLISLWSLKLGGGILSFLLFFLVLFLSVVTANSLVMLVGALVSNPVRGYLILLGLEAFFLLSCGYFIQRPQIPIYWQWLHYVSPMTYSYEASLKSEFPLGTCFSTGPNSSALSGSSTLVPTGSDSCSLNGHDVLTSFLHIDQLRIEWDILFLLVWCILYRIALYIAFRSHSKSHWK